MQAFLLFSTVLRGLLTSHDLYKHSRGTHTRTKRQSQTTESEQLANQSMTWERAHYELFLLQWFLILQTTSSRWGHFEKNVACGFVEKSSPKGIWHVIIKIWNLKKIHFLNLSTPNVFHTITPHMFGWTGRAQTPGWAYAWERTLMMVCQRQIVHYRTV